MHKAQEQVQEFHDGINVAFPPSPAIKRPALRATLIEEEAKETVEAILDGDMVEAIDGMCDLLVVVYGTAAEWGLDLEPFFNEVHRTNMAKLAGPKRADGKQLKPEGWKPPEIAKLLAGQVLAGNGLST